MKWQELFYNDVQAYMRHEDINWVYNKMALIKGQGIACAPVGVYPTNYPVCVKPIINLYGMSRDAHLVESSEDYEEYLLEERPSGQFWMPFLSGTQHTVDMLFRRGKIVFVDAFKCTPSDDIFGLFDSHVHVNDYVLPKNVADFLERKLRRYTGPLNVEIIDNVVIEVHLRWNGDNYMWRRRTEFIKCLPLWLSQCRAIPRIQEDVAYIPCFVDRDADLEVCQSTLYQYNDTRLRVHLDDVDGEHQQQYIRIGMFVVRNEDAREVKLIKIKNNWI